MAIVQDYHPAMRQTPVIAPWDCRGMSPLDAVRAWPTDRPLMALHSGRIHPRFARFSILASPAARFRFTNHSHWIGDPPPPCELIRFTHDPLTDLDQILTATRIEPGSRDRQCPFRGGWIGALSYELGRLIEPAATHRPQHDLSWPRIELAWCPDALVFDHVNDAWHTVGSPPPLSPVQQLAFEDSADPGESYALGPIDPLCAPDAYVAMVKRALRDIAAGDIFQVNLAQHLAASFAGSTRALFIDAMRQAMPWYGAYMELDDLEAGAARCAISLSPELFLQADLTSRDIFTRPVKGTRPASASPSLLRDSSKDAAELHMIIDLMRNDLGRVCEYGSVRVNDPRSVESHLTVHHGVGEVAGVLTPDTTVGDVLRATFPPGSVTGAPKIRAMQIIDELEPSPREWYCGSIGCFGDDGRIALNVAIRTLLLEGTRNCTDRVDQIDGHLDYAAGAGIVSESDPMAEFRETLDKTAALRAIASQRGLARVASSLG